MDWFHDWHPMDGEEINTIRVKAYLNWEEMDEVEELDPPYETYFYKNKRGEDISCRILVRRKNGEIIVRNQNGVDVCLTENDLFK